MPGRIVLFGAAGYMGELTAHYGELAVGTAIRRRRVLPRLDSAIREVFERPGPRAHAAGCALLTAFGYDLVHGTSPRSVRAARRRRPRLPLLHPRLRDVGIYIGTFGGRLVRCRRCRR